MMIHKDLRLKRGTTSKILLMLVPIALGFSSCSKNEKFIYHENIAENPWIDKQVNIKEIHGASGIDIIWVIDNSGSMYWAQQNVINNAASFMQEFTKNSLNWKIGLLSTDISDLPYLGFALGDEFDWRTPDPVSKFRFAVSRLGTSGDAEERSFEPVYNNITYYQQFLRPQYPLAVIFVTDEDEQSSMTPQMFASFLRQTLGSQKLYAYGIFGAEDLKCNEGSFTYAGSPYEEFLGLADLSKAYPLCAGDFGQVLADMGQEIAEQVTRSQIYLEDRPILESISVFYEGEALPGGPRSDGGIWYYDYGKNAIVFYNLSFAPNPEDSVIVRYKVDDGYPL